MPHRPGATLRPLVKLGSTPESCWHWLGYIQPSGDAMKQFHGRSIPARRWLWSQLFGPIKPGFVIAQMCGDKACVNPFHLKLMTMADAQRAGLSSTLTRGDITAIREAEGQATAAALGKDFGVSAQTIREIWRGDTWTRRTRHPTAGAQTMAEAA